MNLYRIIPIKKSYGFAFFFLSQLLLIVFLVASGCEEKQEKPGEMTAFSQKKTCVGCHTDAEALQALATPEPPPSSSGGG